MSNLNNKYTNIKILIATHKPESIIRQNDVFFPIHVGKSLHPDVDLGYPGDNTGDNISGKNASYCELTALYWAWKNLKNIDYIGLCHYRRYFKFNNIFNLCNKSIDEMLFPSKKQILKKIGNNDIIVAKPFKYPYNLFDDYAICHNGLDMRFICNLIKESFSIYYESTKEILTKSNALSPYNMFIMKWHIYDEYCSFLFPLLEKVEREIIINNYSPYQKRIYGFIAERLLNVFIHYNRKKYSIKKCPIQFIDNKIKIYPSILHNIRNIINDISFNITSSMTETNIENN